MSKETENQKIEEKKLLGKKRVFFALIAVDVILAGLFVWALVEAIIG